MENLALKLKETPESDTRQRRSRTATCLSCGTDLPRANRRYCSKECRQQIHWVLALSKGLLRTLNARYAAFSFTREEVILDVLPVWSKGISRFIQRRSFGRKPAEDLKHLILQAGRRWHAMVNQRISRSYATYYLITHNRKQDLDPGHIKPNRQTQPRLSKAEQKSLRILNLAKDDLFSEEYVVRIKNAYRRMSKQHHPDMGGSAEKFRELTAAQQQLLVWAANPQFTRRTALAHCWSYDGATNRWSPPL